MINGILGSAVVRARFELSFSIACFNKSIKLFISDAEDDDEDEAGGVGDEGISGEGRDCD